MVGEPPVRVAEECEVGDPDRGRGLGLLDPAEGSHLLAGDAPVGPARITVGDDAIGHGHAGVGPFRGGSRIPEVAVVGVGDNHEDAFDSFDL